MFKTENFINRSDSIPSSFGIYIAQPIGNRMRVIDKRRSHLMPSVNENYIKFGKSQNLKQRFKSYYFDNDGEVDFFPVLILDDFSAKELKALESLIKSKVSAFRVRNPKTKRPLEWLEGIELDDLRSVINKCYSEFERCPIPDVRG